MKSAPLPGKQLSCGEFRLSSSFSSEHTTPIGMKNRMKKWEVLRSVYVKRSPWVNWRVDTCRLANGHKIEEYHISEIPTGVGVVALTPRNEVILVRQYRHGTRKILLEIPGGMVSPSDPTPLAAARRELREETGYSSQSWTLLAELFLHPPSQDNLIFMYLARNARRTSHLNPDQGEEIEVRPTPFKQVLEIIRKKRFKSLGSTAAILLAGDRIRI